MERDKLIAKIREYFGLKTVILTKTKNSADVGLSSPTGKLLVVLYLNKSSLHNGWWVSGCSQGVLHQRLDEMLRDAD